ncbi:THAP9 transposase, partial [Xiphorhynchus elegans]|nr:THAP9 transposase [Xiphorhynchus elegans]
MTRSCSARGCSARDTARSRARGLSFHQFPADPAQRRQWVLAVKRADPHGRRLWRAGPGAILCSRHFAQGDFESYGLRRKLRRGAVPSRFPPGPRQAPRRSDSDSDRHRPPVRALKRPPRSPPGGDHNYSLRGQRTDSSTAGGGSAAPRPRPAPRVLGQLAERRHLPEQVLSLLRAQFAADLPCELHSWRQMAEYSPEMRQFACILYLYHTESYDYLQKIFPLPHPCSLTWLSNSEAAAGFSNDIFLWLQEKVKRENRAYRYCTVMVQDMSLQKQQQWDPQTGRLTGFVDLGAGILDADEAPLASEVIILMAVGISSPWTAPLGYFFVNSTTGHLLAQLFRQAISKLNNIGIVVLAVTSGASAHGAETARALGVRIDPERIQCTFHHPPRSAQGITYFFDVCHALQLIRNALQCFQKVEWLSDTMWWQHVVELAALPEQRILGQCSPKSDRSGSKESYHLKVNLATLLFSEGVADGLEHLQNLGLASFQNCSGTVKFVRLMSNLCNVFYGRGPYGKGLNKLLLAGNYTKISNLFNEAKSFFVTLTDSMGRYIIKSKRKLGFLSFLLNAESLKWLYSRYVCAEGTTSHHLQTCAFSLDPLELFLRAIQQACGTSGSPTCAVFQAAYHKLLASFTLSPGSPHGNASGNMSLLDISLSRRRDLTLGSVRAQCNPARGRALAREYPFSGDGNKNTKLWHLSLEQKVFQELLGESPLFPTLTNHLFDGGLSISNHYTVLVKEITRCYLNIRINSVQHLNLKYCCGKHRLKRLKGKHLFLSPLDSCQLSCTHTGS